MSKFCQKCGTELPDDAQFCTKCGFNFVNPENNTNNYVPQYNATPAKKKDGCLKGLVIILGVLIGFIFIISIVFGGNSKSKSKSSKLKSSNKQQTTTNATAEIDETINEESYEHNSYFDITDATSSTDLLGGTTIIHKVEAKQDVTVSATMIASSADGSIVGKSDDEIVLTAGQINYFEFYFDGNISNAQLSTTAKAESDGLLSGERNGVELEKYDINNDSVFLTVNQTVDDISFAKFKLLYYKDDKLVGSERGYFSTRAKNLDGVGSSDVVKISTRGKKIDKIEYIYEP